MDQIEGIIRNAYDKENIRRANMVEDIVDLVKKWRNTEGHLREIYDEAAFIFDEHTYDLNLDESKN